MQSSGTYDLDWSEKIKSYKHHHNWENLNMDEIIRKHSTNVNFPGFHNGSGLCRMLLFSADNIQIYLEMK